MTISQLLEDRLEDLCPSTGSSWPRRLWLALHGTWLSLLATTLVSLLAIVDCFTKESYLRASLGIRFVTGITGCFAAQIIYLTRRGMLHSTIGRMAAVARHLEALQHGDILAGLERVALRCRRLDRAVKVYTATVVLSILMPTLLGGQLCMPTWPQPEDTPVPYLAMAVDLVLQVITGTSCPIAFYSFMGLLGAAQMSCAALYRGTGTAVVTASGREDLRAAARMHAMLCEYTGRWYEIEAYSQVWELGGKCSTADYTLQADGKVHVKNAMRFWLGNDITQEGYAEIASDNGDAELLVTFQVPIFGKRQANYWVLDTDYVNYSVVYSCADLAGLLKLESAWILSRDATLAADSKDLVEAAIQNAGLNRKAFKPTKQDC